MISPAEVNSKNIIEEIGCSESDAAQYAFGEAHYKITRQLGSMSASERDSDDCIGNRNPKESLGDEEYALSAEQNTFEEIMNNSDRPF